MDINIQSQVGLCEEFMVRAGSDKEAVSIVISPLKVTGIDESNIRVINGCNMWQACWNRRCHFSAAARKLPRIEGTEAQAPVPSSKHEG